MLDKFISVITETGQILSLFPEVAEICGVKHGQHISGEQLNVCLMTNAGYGIFLCQQHRKENYNVS